MATKKISELTALTTPDGAEELVVNDSGVSKKITIDNIAQENFTSTLKTKLDGVESGATADQTGAEIKTAYEAELNTNAFTDADHSKLDGIEAGAEVNNISDINATGLTGAGDSSLHYHSTDRARANHTGTQTLSTISDVTSTAAELNILDGVTATTAELNYVDGVTSAIQTQLDGKTGRTSSTGSSQLPSGTTAQRDGTPAAGYLRFNSTDTAFEGYNGTAWGAIGGATGGGSDQVFVENDQTVTTNYTLTANKNASSVGPITINTGVTVTVPSGAHWVVL